MKHLLSINDLNRSDIEHLIQTTHSLLDVSGRQVKKVPLLRGKTVMNLFFEPSTRTRTTFELAAKRLSADVLNINIAQSATTKGESLNDMLRNLQAMAANIFVIRHSASGASHYIAQHVSPNTAIINAGDGRHAHPTQALLDMFTIEKHKGDIRRLNVAIVGDLLHSRVARSQITALHCLGAKSIRLIAPRTLLPRHMSHFPVEAFTELKAGLQDADVIIMLRLQKERMTHSLLPSEQEYFEHYGLSPTSLAYANPDALVMHPGPINRGVEIASEVADGPQSVILQQVTYGIAMRMAIMSTLAVTAQQAEPHS